MLHHIRKVPPTFDADLTDEQSLRDGEGGQWGGGGSGPHVG